MDNIVIMFACVLATVTGLNFMELRKIRKHLQREGAAQKTSVAPTAVGESTEELATR